MKIGSLVQNTYGDIGVVVRQIEWWGIGHIDRWMVHWCNGQVYVLDGSSLSEIA